MIFKVLRLNQIMKGLLQIKRRRGRKMQSALNHYNFKIYGRGKTEKETAKEWLMKQEENH